METKRVATNIYIERESEKSNSIALFYQLPYFVSFSLHRLLQVRLPPLPLFVHHLPYPSPPALGEFLRTTSVTLPLVQNINIIRNSYNTFIIVL